MPPRGDGTIQRAKNTMRRKILSAVLTILFSVAVNLAQAQQPKKVPRIGYLSPRDPASESSRSEAIRLALRSLGYIEGQNIAIEYRYGEGRLDRLPEVAAELVKQIGLTIPNRVLERANKVIK